MKTEKALSFFIISGLLLTFFYIPGGKLFLILSMFTISLIYFPFGFYFLSDKKVEKETVGFSIVSGLFFSTLALGILFSVMRWSGSDILLVSGLISCLPIAAISYIKYKKPKQVEQITYYKNIFTRAVILIVSSMLYFIF